MGKKVYWPTKNKSVSIDRNKSILFLNFVKDTKLIKILSKKNKPLVIALKL